MEKTVFKSKLKKVELIVLGKDLEQKLEIAKSQVSSSHNRVVELERMVADLNLKVTAAKGKLADAVDDYAADIASAEEALNRAKNELIAYQKEAESSLNSANTEISALLSKIDRLNKAIDERNDAIRVTKKEFIVSVVLNVLLIITLIINFI